MSEYRIARVLVRGIPAGVLCETDAGYDEVTMVQDENGRWFVSELPM